MTVSTFIQPDRSSQSGTQYPANIDAAIAVLSKIGLSFAPHEQSTPDMTVKLDAGRIYDPSAQTVLEIAAQSTGTITAPTANPRIDRIVVDHSTGAVSVATGIEAASPVAPPLPAGTFPVAQLTLAVTTTTIINALITDERGAFNKPALATGVNDLRIEYDGVAWNAFNLVVAQGAGQIEIDGEVLKLATSLNYPLSGLIPNTAYYVWAFSDNGSIALEISDVASSSYTNYTSHPYAAYQTGDPSRRLVGAILSRTATDVHYSGYGIFSYENRKLIHRGNLITPKIQTETSWTKLDPSDTMYCFRWGGNPIGHDTHTYSMIGRWATSGSSVTGWVRLNRDDSGGAGGTNPGTRYSADTTHGVFYHLESGLGGIENDLSYYNTEFYVQGGGSVYFLDWQRVIFHMWV